MRHISLAEVVALHRRVIEASGGSHGVRDLGLIESAIAQPRMSFGGEALYPGVVDKAAALCFSLVTNHPFVDGNKRVARDLCRELNATAESDRERRRTILVELLGEGGESPAGSSARFVPERPSAEETALTTSCPRLPGMLRPPTLLTLSLLLFAFGPPTSASILYGVDSNAQQSGGTSRLFEIDKGTGHITEVGEMGRQVLAGGMAYDSSTGTLYVSDILIVNPPTFGNYLGSIDLSTGAATVIGQLGGGGSNAVTGLAYDSTRNVLYGSGNGPSNANRLMIVDRASGALTLVGSMGVRIDGMAYDKATDRLFGINATGLYTIDRTTGAATLVGPHGISTTSLNLGLELDLDSGRLFASDTEGLHELNPATGASTFIGLLGAEIEALASVPDCVPSETTLCLNNGRFKVEATYRTAQATGPAHAVMLTPDSGYMWFFSSSNIEVVIKILDACALNQKYWVFAAGLTNQQVDITIIDTSHDVSKTYSNPLGRTFVTITDTSAFSTCP